MKFGSRSYSMRHNLLRIVTQAVMSCITATKRAVQMVSNIDFPFVAFVPSEPAYCVTSVTEVKEFIEQLRARYVLALNPGWFKQLGIGVTPKGRYEV